MSILGKEIARQKKELKEIKKNRAISEARKIANDYANGLIKEAKTIDNVAELSKKVPYKTSIRKFINSLYEPNSALENMLCEIKVYSSNQKEEDMKSLYDGKISEVPDDILDMNWTVVTMGRKIPNGYNELEAGERTPIYNLPYIIVVI